MPQTSRIKRSAKLRCWSAGLVLALLPLSEPVRAQTRDDVERVREEREEIREEAADIAAQIDALGDESAELLVRLDLLEAAIAVADSRLEVARRRAESTEEEVSLVDARIDSLEQAQDELQQAVLGTVVDEYIAGHDAGQGSVLSSEDPVDWSLRQGVYSLVVTNVTSTSDQLRVVEAHLAEARETAVSLALTAAQDRREVDTFAADAHAAKVIQVEVLGMVQQRLNNRLDEAEALADLDAELSEEIRRGEAEIARRLAIVEALLANPGGESGSRKELIARPDEIVTVRGIDIHQTISDQLLRLINAAEVDGIVLGGAGWRSTEGQIDLRIQNCGSTDYLIFDAPAEACFPPTARPATSNHEAGLAVDFTADGRAIVDRNSPAFAWLQANASSYGFYNLWSEPWHWSVDGR